MFSLDHYLAERRSLVEKALDREMPASETRPQLLHEAMRYTVFSGGKRIRPILTLAAAEAIGGTPEAGLLPGVAIELLHTYTLIHDDLPCMDDDDLRRGRPTCHIKFGEAHAVLTGDALQALAFDVAARVPVPPPYHPMSVVRELACAAGSTGVVGGQVEDILAGQTQPDAATIDYIHLHKTADLFRAALRMGAMSAAARETDLNKLTQYGTMIGLAFQITDDLLDASEENTKKKRDKLSCLSVYAVSAAQERASAFIASALLSLDGLPGNTAPLAAIAKFVLARKN